MERYLFGAGMTWDLSFPDCTAPVCSTQPGEDRVTLQDEAGGTGQEIGHPVWLFVPPAHACSTSEGCPINTGHCALWLIRQQSGKGHLHQLRASQEG